MSSPATLDLDAARREAANPDGIIVRIDGNDLTLPSELPVDIFDPLLDPELDLAGLIKHVLEGDDSDDFTKILLDLLESRPSLFADALDTIKSMLTLLFGAEQYALFLASRPSVNDYLRLVQGLVKLYGVGLGEAFASLESSTNGGATPNPISGSTRASTPEPVGVAPDGTVYDSGADDSVPAMPGPTAAPVAAPVVDPLMGTPLGTDPEPTS